jgi:hypothetical protein
MPLYVCRFCNYTNITKNKYYSHYHTHITVDNISTFSDEEIKLCDFYYNKKTQRNKEYNKNNKEKIAQYDKTYRKNNKEKILENNRKYRLKKRQTQEDNILDVSDDELIISDSD